MTSDIGLTTSNKQLVSQQNHQDSCKKINTPSETMKEENSEDYVNNTIASNVQNGQQVRHLEPRPFRPFKSSEEYLYAMKEDLAEWLNALYNLSINVDNFMEKLETGVILCRHANNIIRKARANPNLVNNHSGGSGGTNPNHGSIPIEKELSFRADVNPGTFHARDNVSNFISWCRKLGIMECLLFETDDLVLRKNEKSFILCLLEIARQGTKIGMIAPMLVQLEQEIDREIAQDAQSSIENDKLTTTTKGKDEISSSSTPITSDDNKENRKALESMKNLHEMVVDILSRCSCPSAFPMVKVADGKYRIGDTKVLIFVRILRNHVMVRVGGGWDTLGHYLDRHDPCRCRAGHRFSTSAKVTFTDIGDPSSGPQMVVTYNRPEDPISTPMGQVNNSINNSNLINRASVTINQSPNHNLKRRANGSVTSDYLNGQSIVTTPNVNTSKFINSNGNGNRLARRDSITNPVNTNEITPRFPSSISTSSTLSSSSSTSSTGYPDGLLIDRQESRTSHYSDDSTDGSSVIMESPSPTQQLESQLDDCVDQHQESTNKSSTKLINENSSKMNNKTIKPMTTVNKQTRGNYHDSSSSEFSESENNHNCGKNLLGGSRRRCSPRKIMKTSDLLGTEKPSWASDDFTIDNKDSFVKPEGRDSRIDRMASVNVSSSPFQRNCRYRRSEQKISTAGSNGFNGKGFSNGSDDQYKNKSRSSENLSQIDSNSNGGGKMNWKNPINTRARAVNSISASPARKISSPKRVGTETPNQTPISCFERGRNYYASLPRSRSTSQSSRTPLTDNNKTIHGNTPIGTSPFVRGSPGRYSLNTPRGSLPESLSLGSCRSDRFGYGSSATGKLSRQNSTESGETIRTWAFKSRTRPALDPDLFTKPSDSSRSSFRYGHRPTTTTPITTKTPGQRSRSSDSSPSRVPLHTTTAKMTNGVTNRPAVKLINQLNNCQVKSSSLVGDANNNHFSELKDINDNNNTKENVNNHDDQDDDDQLINLENDIMKTMETLVNQYQSRVERATPCKIVNSSESINSEVDCDGKSNDSVINCSHQKFNSSKIPMPIRATPRKEY